MTPYETICQKIDSGRYHVDFIDKHQYRAAQQEKRDLFAQDLSEAYGLANHPRKDILFKLAWDRGHSGGFSEILNEYDDLSQLIVGGDDAQG